MAHRLDGRRRRAEDHRGTREPAELQRRVAGLEPGRPVALVGRVVLLVHHDQADVRQRREQGRPRPDDEVRLAGADPAPLVGALPVAQGGVHDGDPDREVRPQPVHDGRGQGDLGDEQERGPAGSQGGGDGLHVDRGLAAAGDPVEQDRRWIARCQGVQDQPDRRRPGPASARNPPGARRGSGRGGSRGAGADARAPPRAGGRGGRDRRWTTSRGARRPAPPARRPAETAPGDTSSARAALWRGPRGRPGTRSPVASATAVTQALGRDPQPSLVARADGRAEQRPGQLHEALVGECAEAPQQGGPTLGAREVADGTGPPGQLVEQVDLGRGQPRIVEAHPRLAGRRHLRHELQPLEHPRRQHRADHDGQRGQVPRGQLRGKRQREGRQQRPVGADPGGDRPDGVAGRRLPRVPPPRRPRCRSPGDPRGRTAPAPPRRARGPRDRGARGRCRCAARVRPGRPRPPRPGGRRAARARARRDPGRAWAAPRSPQPTRIRRSALRRFSCSMIASISAAVRSTSPVSFTTTRS